MVWTLFFLYTEYYRMFVCFPSLMNPIIIEMITHLCTDKTWACLGKGLNYWLSSLKCFSQLNHLAEMTVKRSVQQCSVCYSFPMKLHIWVWTGIITHIHLSLFSQRRGAVYQTDQLQLTYTTQSECCRWPSSEKICFMAASYWIWISFIILFLILKVTLAFVLISSWYAGPMALVSLLLLLGRSKLGWLLSFQEKNTSCCKWWENVLVLVNALIP